MGTFVKTRIAPACAAGAAMLEQTKNVEKRSARRSSGNVVSIRFAAKPWPRGRPVEKLRSGHAIAATLRHEGRALG